MLSLISQQDPVLEELVSYCESAGASGDEDKQTLMYLTALSKMFEHGILSNAPLSTTEAKQLKNMESGFKYFEDWCLDVRAAGIDPDDTTQRSFLAWQVSRSRLCNTRWDK